MTEKQKFRLNEINDDFRTFSERLENYIGELSQLEVVKPQKREGIIGEMKETLGKVDSLIFWLGSIVTDEIMKD